MRSATIQYTNPESRTVSVRNNNASAVFLDGRPVFLDPKGTGYLGTDSKLFNEASVSGILAGIYRCSNIGMQVGGLQVGDVGEAVAFGFTDAVVVRRTRAATTDTWATAAAIAVNDQLIPVTDGLGALSRQGTLAASNHGVAQVVAADSLATAATGASTYASGQTADTARLKVFVRAMG